MNHPGFANRGCRLLLAVAVAFMGFSNRCTAEGKLPGTNGALLHRIQAAAASADHITIHPAGVTELGQTIPAVHVAAGRIKVATVMLIAQQHGDEPAGAEALVRLIEQSVHRDGDESNPRWQADYWIIPRVNLDGAAAGTRQNANAFDLNRDHLILSQSETRAVHDLARRVQPDAFFDCHEFTRDPSDYRSRGWTRWPIIMIDTANLTLLPSSHYETGVTICQGVVASLNDRSINADRYHVGDPPGVGEVRPSTLDADDARNAMSVAGAMSFIIESGVCRDAQDPNADLVARIAAYDALLTTLFDSSLFWQQVVQQSQLARQSSPPPTIATDVFWASDGVQTEPNLLSVHDIHRRETVRIPASNYHQTRVVKRYSTTPAGYAIIDGPAIRTLLNRHGLPYQTIRRDMLDNRSIENFEFVRLESDYDTIYHRYGGRLITRLKTPAERPNQPWLLVDLKHLTAVQARQAILLLEPTMLYGIYQWPQYRGLITGRQLPVQRLID